MHNAKRTWTALSSGLGRPWLSALVCFGYDLRRFRPTVLPIRIQYSSLRSMTNDQRRRTVVEANEIYLGNPHGPYS